jgi:hypothetical protein
VSRTFGQIQFELTHFAKAKGLPAVDFELLRGWINEAYNDVCDQRQWKGLEAQSLLSLVPVYTTGTVTATNGSTAITGTATSWTSDLTGRQIRIAGRGETYGFTYVSATSGTLSRAYEGPTIADAAYVISKTTYAMADSVKAVTMMVNPNIEDPMTQINEDELNHITTARDHVGEPRFFLPANDTGDPPSPVYRQVRIYPPPQEAVTLIYTYLKHPTEFTGTNTETGLYPWVDPRAVIAGAKAMMLAHFQMYDGSAAEMQIQQQAVRKMQQAETDLVGPTKLRMHPRYTRHRRARGGY